MKARIFDWVMGHLSGFFGTLHDRCWWICPQCRWDRRRPYEYWND